MSKKCICNNARHFKIPITWIQCDICDRWFHLDCLNCDSNDKIEKILSDQRQAKYLRFICATGQCQVKTPLLSYNTKLKQNDFNFFVHESSISTAVTTKTKKRTTQTPLKTPNAQPTALSAEPLNVPSIAPSTIPLTELSTIQSTVPLPIGLSVVPSSEVLPTVPSAVQIQGTSLAKNTARKRTALLPEILQIATSVPKNTARKRTTVIPQNTFITYSSCDLVGNLAQGIDVNNNDVDCISNNDGDSKNRSNNNLVYLNQDDSTATSYNHKDVSGPGDSSFDIGNFFTKDIQKEF